MKIDDVEQDTIQLRIKCSDEGDMRVSLGYDLDEDMDPAIMAKYLAIAHGIMAMLEVSRRLLSRQACTFQWAWIWQTVRLWRMT